MERRRVVITGMGVVTPLGCGVRTYWDALLSGTSGIGRITNFDPEGFASQIGGEVAGFESEAYLDPKEARRMDAFCQFGVAAAKMAVEDAGLAMPLEDAERVGVLVGSGTGGISVIETQLKVLLQKGPRRMSPYCIPQMISNITAGYIAIEYGMKGPNFGIVSACTSAAHCMGEAMRMIRHDEADVMVAGGSEAAITSLSVGGFAAMKALSTRNDDPQGASRPFDADRDGFVIGEGGGIVVLEELEYAKRRGAAVYCELAGYGRTCDAYHITAPVSTGEGGRRAMELAMQDAGLNPGEIDYINAHGTSTALNDRCETLAVKRAMGEDVARRLAISSTKSMTGHLLGAAGAIEAVACVMAMREGAIPPTINYTTPDPDCDLDYTPNEARAQTVGACLSNSLGFGGHNATLCLRAC